MRSVGIDQSTTATGIAIINGHRITTLIISSKPRTGETLTAKYDRINRLATQITHTVRHAHPDIITIETPAMSANNTGTVLLNYLYGAIIAGLHGITDNIITITPATLKKYATGSGATRGPNKTSKQDIINAAHARYPHADHPLTSDEADALTLAAMGARALGHPVEDHDLPPACLDAHRAVRWPDPVRYHRLGLGQPRSDAERS